MDADREAQHVGVRREQHEPVSVVLGDHSSREYDLILDASKTRPSRVGHSAPFSTKIVERIMQYK